MEDKIRFTFFNFILIIFALLSSPIFAQTNYEMNLLNGNLVNSTTFEFDVYIKSTGSDFSLTSYQCSFAFNENIIAGDTLFFTYVEGTSDLDNIPENAIGCNNVDGTDKLTFASNAGEDIISSLDLRIGTFRLETDVAFANTTPNIVWCFSGIVTTMLTNNTWVDIANQSLHSDLEFDDPLPVELNSFTASVVEDNIILNWKTATEINNYGFDIERAACLPLGTASSTTPGNKIWGKTGFVQGNGNSNSPIEYSFVDESPIGGDKFYYRLKQIDVNGNFKYSETIEIEYNPASFELFQNYPNPFNPNTKIKFRLVKEGNVKLQVFNILGERVGELINKKLEAGTHMLNFDANNLASGTYFYRLEVENQFTDVKKMILMK